MGQIIMKRRAVVVRITPAQSSFVLQLRSASSGLRSSCGPAYSDLYRPAQLRCQWTAYMQQFTRSLTFTEPLVALIQAPAEILSVPSLRV